MVDVLAHLVPPEVKESLSAGPVTTPHARVERVLTEYAAAHPDAVTRFLAENRDTHEGGETKMNTTAFEKKNDENGALVAAARDTAAIMDRVLAVGDLNEITHEERVQYYLAVCQSLKLNPYTRPFGYVEFSEKVGDHYEKRMVLYARKDCAEQLRRRHGVSITSLVPEREGDLYTVTATARTADGRTDMDQGVVSLGNLSGNFLANARMRCVTKAKRRVTLSLVGLGIMDETEIDSLHNARTVQVNEETGEILDEPAPPAALPPRRTAPAPAGTTPTTACVGCGTQLAEKRLEFCAKHRDGVPICWRCDEKQQKGDDEEGKGAAP
jgi:hypothetical protein